MLTLAVVAVVIMLNVAVGAVEANWGLTVDMTALGRPIFRKPPLMCWIALKSPCISTPCISPAPVLRCGCRWKTFWKNTRAYNHNIALDTIDPVSEPSRVQQYAGEETVSEGAIIVTNADASRVRVVQRSDYYYNYTSSITRQTHTMFNVEGALTSAHSVRDQRYDAARVLPHRAQRAGCCHLLHHAHRMAHGEQL